MLSQQTIDIVKSTAPVLAEHGEALTAHFYKRMFEHNPEVKPFFNQSNQQSGVQQKALATAITAYAANIDNLAVLGNAIDTIVNKHVSLQIKPEQYPIVGANLLASIKEVLGNAATDDIIKAWNEAYNFLANVLIEKEKAIYQANANVKGGWDGFRDFVIQDKIKESNAITSFYLVPKDGKELPTFLAGQYITVQVPTSDGSTTMRNYSLSDKSGNNYFRISVKKEDKGFVSSLLHSNLQIGDTIKVGFPCGEFVFKPTGKPVIFLAGGVGITPILSMLKTALTTNVDITLLYSAYNPNIIAFQGKINQLAQEYPNFKVQYYYTSTDERSVLADNETKGLITPEVVSALPKNADYYFCGPTNFMLSVYSQLSKDKVPTEQINFEFFGPKEELAKPF
jgi:nitric oxide dioxygenase